MDWIIRTNNTAKALREIRINNVVSAKTYNFLSEIIDIEDLENVNLNNVTGTLNIVGDTNFSIDRKSISSIEIIK